MRFDLLAFIKQLLGIPLGIIPCIHFVIFHFFSSTSAGEIGGWFLGFISWLTPFLSWVVWAVYHTITSESFINEYNYYLALFVATLVGCFTLAYCSGVALDYFFPNQHVKNPKGTIFYKEAPIPQFCPHCGKQI